MQKKVYLASTNCPNPLTVIRLIIDKGLHITDMLYDEKINRMHLALQVTKEECYWLLDLANKHDCILYRGEL